MTRRIMTWPRQAGGRFIITTEETDHDATRGIDTIHRRLRRQPVEDMAGHQHFCWLAGPARMVSRITLIGTDQPIGRPDVCKYNLFRNKEHPELVCAVPEVRPVPPFIAGPPWSFAGCVSDCAWLSIGFNRRAAEASVRYNGFYLFQLNNASDLMRWTVMDPESDHGGYARVRGTRLLSTPQVAQTSVGLSTASAEAHHGNGLRRGATQVRTTCASEALEIHVSR